MSRDRNWNYRPTSLLAFAALASRVLSAATIPAHTTIEARLTSAVGSNTAQVDQTITAAVIAPVTAGNETLIPPGAQLHGSVKQVVRGSATESATLLLEFNEIELAGGTRVPISARLASVDNARETVDADGRIIGIRASETLTAEADRGITKLSERYSGLAGLLGTVKGAFVHSADPTINYGPGVEFGITLLKSATLDASAANSAITLQPFPSADSDLARMVADQPVRAFAVNPVRPSDLTNLLLIGNERDITKAFDTAGWSGASALSTNSKLETLRAVMEDRGYREGPVSILTIDNRPPDLVFQKTNNTFAARHHLRIWHRPGNYAGLPIWLVTATHDIAIDFSETDRTFTHKIDGEIDTERTKVVNDLLFTGAVRSYTLIARPRLPQNATNGTGDKLVTDGHIAVLLLGPLRP